MFGDVCGRIVRGESEVLRFAADQDKAEVHHIEIPLGGHGSGRRKDVGQSEWDRLWLSCGRRGQSPALDQDDGILHPVELTNPRGAIFVGKISSADGYR